MTMKTNVRNSLRRIPPSAVLLVSALAVVPPALAAKPKSGSVTIAAKSGQVVIGKSTVISGTVGGDKNAGVSVTLEGTGAPYTGAYQAVGSPTVTDGQGAYSFRVSPQASTRYHVTAKASPPVTSGNRTVHVVPKVSMRVSDKTPSVFQRIRFSGTVTAPGDATRARVQRHRGKRWQTVKGIPLVAGAPVDGVARSTYTVEKVIVRNSATYRVVVKTSDALGKSSTRRMRVH
jgi:hypothetical protein